MTYASIILAAAKAVKVSGTLLLAICSYETNLTNVTVYHDGNSPSYGICQIKYGTAKDMGYKGKPEGLVNPTVNAKWAAHYLKWQMQRYGNDWCKLASSYNSGTFFESKIAPGKPKNFLYVTRVRDKLEDKFKDRMSCEEE